ncbi:MULTISPECIES: hypothetical protein [Pseudomonas]|jgi:hypothetical protein|uniref:Uncharacterized protein n=1 Tax=Pseudomonas lactis TaxID=1615674 RepID=A0ABS9FHN8_9PSED|nr:MULTISPECIES: hypothetical protein [Pseudomonas]ETK42583.1 hypothetical protein H098_06430 [Pseudomonas fluorescens FH5]SEB83902.1 hypothetical protein SAMN04490199_2904 [Pseudomonas marginalis]ETK13981.1 hypothetical protein H096_31521 [Pseudomonas sp. FH1]KRP68724.1 hypothetical protein TU80_26375 [Pseudomonas veronii]MBI6974099.1 hypothetical protein [Pseudomonas lactis]
MHKVLLAVRAIQKGDVFGYYSHQLTLPFAPFPGLRFEQGTSCTLWKTMTGSELAPSVEQVIYDLDEEQFVCLFDVDIPLKASFWTDDVGLKPGSVSAIGEYFRNMPIHR